MSQVCGCSCGGVGLGVDMEGDFVLNKCLKRNGSPYYLGLYREKFNEIIKNLRAKKQI